MSLFFIAFLISAFVSFLIVKTQEWHGAHSYDHDLDGVQKFHDVPTPRIGGIAIFFSIIIVVNYNILIGKYVTDLGLWWIVAAIPVFLGGLIEDIKKSVSVKDRLLLAFLSATIAYYSIGAQFIYIDWFWFEQNILTFYGVSLFLTIIMVGGVANATNIIDGFNGLLLGYIFMVLSVITLITYQITDIELMKLSLIFQGSVLGLFIFNFPKAKIFSGDSGAYLVGFLIVTFSLLLVNRNSQVSPWFPLAVLIYPVFETFFSIYRKKVLRNKSPSKPDAIHLHMLIYQRLVSNKAKYKNALTSIIIWLLTLPNISLALFYWDNTIILIFSALLFCVLYVWFYFKIVRFKFRKN